MSYRDKLLQSAARARSILCLGIDPMLEYFPGELRPTGTFRDIRGITTLVHTALEALEERDLQPGAFKPNIGYFSACDRPLEFELPLEERFSGSLALAEVMRILRERMPGVPIILDSKRGDIARSSTNYALEAFQGWQADAVTVSPWMGDDSVMPFLHAGSTGSAGSDGSAASTDRGIYLLVRTSNPGAARFQNVLTEDLPLYRRVLQVAREWSGTAGATIGAVVGATAPRELAEITLSLRASPIPLLVPGIGRQGGTAEEVLRVLKETGYPPELVRVNVSSGICFPWAGGSGNSGAPRLPAPADWRSAVRDAVAAAWADLCIHPAQTSDSAR
ncbi:MAG: orotidine-5'-phosphate decarboxylase [Spirochaetaceae bacterium]|nr:MAG: orotidine-5'-phosphate decarboxylase [Spirochaetaceae bacterium]